MREILDHAETNVERSKLPRHYFVILGVLACCALVFMYWGRHIYLDIPSVLENQGNMSTIRLLKRVIMYIFLIAAPLSTLLAMLRVRLGWFLMIICAAFTTSFITFALVVDFSLDELYEVTLMLLAMTVGGIFLVYMRSTTILAFYKINRRTWNIIVGCGGGLGVLFAIIMGM